MDHQRTPALIGTIAGLLLAVFLATAAPAASQAGLSLRVDDVATDEFPAMRISVTVRDANGVPVTGLSAANFHVIEDDKAAVISPSEVIPQVNPAVEIAVMLALDVSGSMSGQPLVSAKAAANSFLDSLTANDRGAILAFSNDVNLGQPFPIIDESKEHAFTNDKNALRNVVNFLEAGGNTPLYDAALKAVKMAAQEARGNRAVILLTDGRDEVLGGPVGSGSKIATADDPILEANRANIPVFTIGLGREIDRDYLQRVALRTGGVYQDTPDPEQLTQLFQNVFTQLKQQYVLLYASSVPDLDTTHRVLVRITTGSEQATDGATFGVGSVPAGPAGAVEQKVEELKETAQEIIEEEEEAILTRIRNYVEDNTRNVAIGAGGVVLLLAGLVVVLRRRRPRAERCPTCGREMPASGVCPYCEGWTGEFEAETPAPRAAPSPPRPEPRYRATVPPTMPEVEPTVHVQPPPAKPPAEEPPIDKTRVVERPPKHVGLLMVQQGPQPGARFEVTRSVTNLGRHEGNDIRLEHPTVSREHARIRLQDDTFVIFDLGSANGTKVNGALVEEPRPLKDGDEVQLGNVVMVFKVIV